MKSLREFFVPFLQCFCTSKDSQVTPKNISLRLGQKYIFCHNVISKLPPSDIHYKNQLGAKRYYSCVLPNTEGS